jgi:hypothetical protein
MTMTTRFTADPKGFASEHPLLVSEAAVPQARKDEIAHLAGPGPHALAPAANYLLSFQIISFAPNKALCEIHPAGTVGCVACYFLPYRPDTAISLTLAGNADYFFTSTLTGCSVRAEGQPATPRVTHANGRTTYQNDFGAQQALNHVDDDDTPALQTCDTHASAAAQVVINGMFPAALGGGATGTVTKQDYLGALTTHNLNRAKSQVRKKPHHRLHDYTYSTYRGYKPEIGGFVFGVRSNAQGWQFYLQSSIGVLGTRKTGIFGIGAKSKSLSGYDVVLGSPERFFP